MDKGPFDLLDLLLILNFLTLKVTHIKDVGDLITFYASLGNPNIQAEVKECSRYEIKEPDSVTSKDLYQGKKV